MDDDNAGYHEYVATDGDDEHTLPFVEEEEEGPPIKAIIGDYAFAHNTVGARIATNTGQSRCLLQQNACCSNRY
jgi:hypothetical protein